jgi:S1-C subfamily serine protease
VDLKEAIRVARPTVVQVRNAEQVLGTGFFVSDDGIVATARHVVEGQDSLLVGLAQPDTENMRANFTLVGSNVLAQSERHDLALLRMRANPFQGQVSSGMVIDDEAIPLLFGVTQLDSARPEDGEPIAISGYPLSNPVLVTTSGGVASAWSYDMAEVAIPGRPEGFKMPDIADLLLADVQANPGNSGGPVYRVADAAVLGVCIEVQGSPVWGDGGPLPVASNAGLTVARPARYVVELMTTAGV